MAIAPVTVAGNGLIGAVESSTSDDVATVIVALGGPSAPTHDPIRACTEYVHAPTGTLFSTQLVVVTTSQPVSTTWATFEVS